MTVRFGASISARTEHGISSASRVVQATVDCLARFPRQFFPLHFILDPLRVPTQITRAALARQALVHLAGERRPTSRQKLTAVLRRSRHASHFQEAS